MKSKTESRTEKETEKEKVEGLMKPRYRVIADYPMGVFGIRDIIQPDINCLCCVLEGGYYTSDLRKFPDIFKHLEWWEGRGESEMPKYVKNMSNAPEVRKVIEYRPRKVYSVAITMDKPFGRYDREFLMISDTLPATREEYESYLNKKK